MLELYGTRVRSRIMVGTALYTSPDLMKRSVEASGAEIVTASVRREGARERSGQQFWEIVRGLGVHILPNTAGCHTAREAVTTAMMARELFATDWIKLEVIANDDTLQPDVFGLVEASRTLVAEGFKVFPYCTDDLSVADKLLAAGCELLMPWASPIGTGRGLINPYALRSLRAYFPDTVLIVDAGLGAPSHAAEAMELGFDAVLLNTAIAKARDPVLMAQAFGEAVRAGRAAFEAGLMPPRDMAAPSTPVAGRALLEPDHAA